MLLLNKNAIPTVITAKTIIGRMNLFKEIPDAFMATNSYDSPKLPKVIMVLSSMAKGKAKGTQLAATYKITFPKVNKSSPLPTNSSIHNQKN